MKKATTIRSISTIFGIIAVILLTLFACKNQSQKEAEDTSPLNAG